MTRPKDIHAQGQAWCWTFQMLFDQLAAGDCLAPIFRCDVLQALAVDHKAATALMLLQGQCGTEAA